MLRYGNQNLPCLLIVFAVLLVGRIASAQPANPPSIYLEPEPSADTYSDSVGATPAEFRVDESGGASYSVPLFVAPGTAGMSPKLSLEYNSRGSNGPLGPGWVIGGQSAITKCKKDIEHGDGPGPHAGINFDSVLTNNAFCLDGQRLLAKGTGLGACPSSANGGQEFTLELDTATRVCAYKANTTSNGYSRWLAFPKDGSLRSYGNTNDSLLAPIDGAGAIVPEHILTWAIDRVADASGNTVDFEYDRNNVSGEMVLLRMRYTGRVNRSNPLNLTQVRTPYHRVEMTYGALPAESQRIDYIAGGKLTLSKQLTTITAYGSLNNGASPDTEVVVRNYRLAYSAAATGSRLSRLTSLKECAPGGALGETCYPPTRFEWVYSGGTFPQGFQSPPTDNSDYAKEMTYLVDYKVGDVNGDGRQDLVWIKDRQCSGNGSDRVTGATDPQRFRFVVSTGSQLPSGISVPVNASVFPLRISTSSENPVMNCVEGSGATNYKNFAPIHFETMWFLFDFSGDGRDDILLATSSSWRIHKAIQVSGAWTFDPIGTDTGVASNNAVDAFFADFDGNGLPDLWHPVANALTGATFQVRFLQRAPMGSSVAYQFASSSIDIELTGLPTRDHELAIAWDTRSGIQAADFNGDGRSDVALLVLECTITQLQSGSTQKDNFWPSISFSPGGSPSWTTGRTMFPNVPSGEPQLPCDLIQNKIFYWRTFISDGLQANGKYRFAGEACLGGGTPAASNNSCPENKLKGLTLPDINGDGLSDAMYRRGTTSLGQGQQTYHYRINSGTPGAADRFLAQQNAGVSLEWEFADRLQILDVNGDKRQDLLYQCRDEQNGCTNHTLPYPLVANLFGVSGFGATIDATNVNSDVTMDTDVFAAQDPNRYLSILMDIDGSGTPDFVRYKHSDSTQDNLYVAASTQNFGGNDFITLITNGLGAKTSIQYWPMVYSSVYSRAFDGPSKHWGRDSVVFDVFAPLWAIREVQTSAPTPSGACGPDDVVCTSGNTGPNSVARVRYSYEGARVQLGGRGFLGFQKVRTEDIQTRIVTTTEYRQDFPFIGSPFKTDVEKLANALPDPCVLDPNGSGCFIEPPPNCGPQGCPSPPFGPYASLGTGQILSSAENTWSSIPAFNPAVQQAHFPFVQTSDEEKYDLETPGAFSHSAVASYSYDTYGNLLSSSVTSSQDNGVGGSTAVETKSTTNVYGCVASVSPPTISGCAGANLDAELQRLGRLSISTVNSSRPGEALVIRRSSFEYDPSTRLLVSEIQGPYSDEPNATLRRRLELRTDYVLDADGNQTLAVKCSNHYANRTACLDLSGFQQRQWDTDLTRIQRYVRTEYDAKGRFVTGARLPYFTLSGFSEQYSERPGVTSGGVLDRDAFGNPLGIVNAHGVVSIKRYGYLGRERFMRVPTGGFSKTAYEWCQDVVSPDIPVGAPRVNCPEGAVFRVTADSTASQAPYAGQSIAPITFAYFDALGREVLKTTRMFQAASEDPGNVSRWSSVRTKFDVLGRPRAVSVPYFSANPAGSQAAGRAGTPMSASPAEAKTRYDALARTKVLTQPEQAVNGTSQTLATYDKLRTDTTNPRTFVNKEYKNGLGELTRATDADNFSVDYVRNSVGNLREVRRTPANGSSAGVQITTTMGYDRLGRKVTMVDPDKGTWTYEYNALGEVVKETDAKTQSRNFFYDALGRMYKRTENRLENSVLVAEPDSTWEYDTALLGVGPSRAVGLLYRETAGPNYARDFAYDQFGRQTQVTSTLDTVAYYQRATYDQFGRPFQQFDASTSSTSTDGTLTQYSTDGYPIITRESTQGTVGTIYREVLALDQRGQVRKERLAERNDMVTLRTYDDNTGRLLSINTGLSGDGRLQNWIYTYDKHGNLTSRENRAGLSGSQFDLKESFGYDGLDRLATVTLTRFNGTTPNMVTLGLAYDQLGNITSKTGYGGLGAYSYRTTPAGCVMAGPHAVSRAGSRDYCYDANGNQVKSEALGTGQHATSIFYYGYDLPRLITGLESTCTAASAGTSFATLSKAAEFSYGADRARWKQLRTQNSVLISCPGSVAPKSIGEPGAGHSPATPKTVPNKVTTYYVGNVEFIETKYNNLVLSTLRKRYVAGALIVTQDLNSPANLIFDYVLRDSLGSLDAVVDQLGVIKSRHSFDAHGNRRVAEPAGSSSLWQIDPNAALGTTATTRGYTGHEHVEIAGIVHFGGRLYDPQLGRFIQADPLVEDDATQGLNRYTYVLNNPLTLTDPTGYLSLRQVLGIAVGVVFAVISHQYWVLNNLAASFATAVAGGFLSAAVTTGSLKGALWGAATAGVFWGIGTGFSNVTGGPLPDGGIEVIRYGTGAGVSKVAAHAAAGGLLRDLQGGKFGHGFISAGVTEALNPAVEAVSRHTIAGGVTLAATIGGTASRLVGGSFANGAQTAAFQYLYNEVVHTRVRRAVTTAVTNWIRRKVANFAVNAAESAYETAKTEVNRHFANNKYSVEVGVGGTMGGAFMGSVPGLGLFGGVGVSVTITSDLQIALTIEVSGMLGVGTYVGGGLQAGIGVSDAALPSGFSGWEPTISQVYEANAAHPLGLFSVGVQTASTPGSYSANVPLEVGRIGAGYGAMTTISGAQASWTYATDPMIYWRSQ
jgi:RHS repeat-associated protein